MGINQDYLYASEKFSDAASYLQLPHPDGEDRSIERAFSSCQSGLDDLDRRGITPNDSAQGFIEKLRELMDTSGVEDLTGQGLRVERARQLTLDDKLELKNAINALASWAQAQFLDEGKRATMTDGERLLTREEVAQLLRLSPVTVGHMFRRGELPGVKLGRLWRVREADLDEYIRNLSEQGKAKP